MRDFVIIAGWCVAILLALIGAVAGSRAFDKTFRLMGDYHAAPRSYPDRDRTPRPSHP